MGRFTTAETVDLTADLNPSDRGADSARDAGSSSADADPDALQDLGDEIATLAALIHSATHRLLVLIAEFDRRRGWEAGGFRSCADWLAFRTGVTPGAAREKVRAARALEGLPETSASMARGELSFAKVRALTRVATPESETELLEFARGTTAMGLERLVRGWRRLSRLDEEALERERHAARRFSVAPDLDGMYVVRGRLEPEVGAALMRAIEAASDALFRGRRREADPDGDTDREAARRRADAIGLLAERALAAGFGAGFGAGDGDGVSADEDDPPVSGSRAERYQVVLHVDAATLEEGAIEDAVLGEAAVEEAALGEAALAGPRSHLDDGTRVSAETSRRLACDAAVVRVVRGVRVLRGRDGVLWGRDGHESRDGHEGRDGRRDSATGESSVLDVGRRTRTVPAALRRALEIRDRGCRFPGCGLRFTDAHHIRHWADGGRTRLDNLVLLCRRHHRAVHQEGFRIHVGPAGHLNFYDPRGLPLPAMPHPLALPEAAREDPAGALARDGRSRGVDPDWRTASARWKREIDIPLGVLGGAVEALEESFLGGDSRR